MTAQRHLTMEQLEALIQEGVPRRLPLAGTPELQFLVDPSGRGVQLLIPWQDGFGGVVSPLEEIDVSRLSIDGVAYLSIGTADRRLLSSCYLFLTSVADQIQLSKRSAVEAIDYALETWRSLLTQVSLLSPEEQIGLLGELWTAYRLISARGAAAIEAWLGPEAENHDFRVDGVDLEIKATTATTRTHIVSTLEQLWPSQGHELYVLSIQLQPAGASTGASLPDAIAKLHVLLQNEEAKAAAFRRHLDHLGVRERHHPQYTRRYRLRSDPVLVRVDSSFPALSREGLVRLYGPNLSARFIDAKYVVNLDGMGVGETSAPFRQLLPRPAAGDLL